jgi:hypothetical protein
MNTGEFLKVCPAGAASSHLLVVAAEEEEEEEEVDHGLVTGPKYVNWLAEPIPNSSMLVFPTMTAPSDWRGWGNGVGEWGGGGWGGTGGSSGDEGGGGEEERIVVMGRRGVLVGVGGGEGGGCARDSLS